LIIDYDKFDDIYKKVEASYDNWKTNPTGASKEFPEVYKICEKTLLHFHPKLKDDLGKLNDSAVGLFKKFVGKS
jgi:hypothetical protein